MARQEAQMAAAKRSYRHAKDEGNHQEEARWANVIGDMLKNRGEYVEALKWLRLDYEVSMKHLSEKQLLPTCQSLGEVYLRLGSFKDALVYQKKHLEIAKDSADLVEQQRASTQLGRTYHEMFLMSDDDHYSVRNAKKYFKAAMKLARTLRENPPANTSSFLKEYIDAYNNIGMLEMDLDNLEEAKLVLTKGLDICDEEEVAEDDDGRSRLHHNLGKIYMDLRMWDKARLHIEKDILICTRIRHCQGEAKGYINLGELHYRVQKYEEAILCYQKALDLAKSMEDEDALVTQIHQNIDTVKEAIKVMDELKKEEQNLKKLARDMVIAKGTPRERKCLLQQSASLDSLIEKSRMIFAWLKHREFAKRKKRIASELCDKEKLSDSFLTVGESYQKLRNFKKALKWYTKGLELYKSIGNLEGQALAKINVGDILDWDGNWTAALIAFEEGYKIAVEANLPSVQLSALENMHYSHMMRFDNVEEAGRLQLLIDKLKQSKNRETEAYNVAGECCSETDTEGEDHMSNSRSGACCSPKSNSCRFQPHTISEVLNDDAPIISLLRSGKSGPKLRSAKLEKTKTCTKLSEASPKSLSKSTDNQQKVVGRKRIRVVLSDDEDEIQDKSLKGSHQKWSLEDVATSDEFKNQHDPVKKPFQVQDNSVVASKCAVSCSSPVNLEESTFSFKSRSPGVATQNLKFLKSVDTEEVVNASNSAASGFNCGTDVSKDLLHVNNVSHLMLHTSDDGYDQCVAFKIEDEMIQVEVGSCIAVDKLNFESMKVELACLYYLQLPIEKRSKGLLPIIQHMKCDGRALESLESIQTLKDHLGKILVEVYVGGWVQKRIIKMYLNCCYELSEAPNMKLLKKLYNLEVSDDEIIVSECELQDISIMPLLNTLHTHRTVSVLNLSHNVLGNGTMEKLQQVFSVSGQNCGGLTLDLHCNQFGPTALFQICECPLLFARLEVLNISGNRLTDACGSYLSTILENCKALYSLNIERCSITSRTIQKVADALDAGSGLAQLFIGYNNPVSGNAIINLLAKLATLKRFSELSLCGLKLSKRVVDSLCGLAKAPCLSGLMLGGTGLGTDRAVQLTDSLYNEAEELVKLDLSYCGLTHKYISKLNNCATPICSVLELNLGGNPFMPQGTQELVSLLMNSQCSLKILVLNNCQLGLAGVLQIIKALSDNSFLEELNIADNTDPDKRDVLQYDLKVLQPNLILSESSPKVVCVPKEIDSPHLGPCAINTECSHLEVADSEDDLTVRVGAATSGFDDCCTSSCRKSSISHKCLFIQELSTAIVMAKQLRFLDISNNGISPQSSETLYTAWSTGLRADISQRYVKDQTIQFSVDGSKRFRVKPCCKKD